MKNYKQLISEVTPFDFHSLLIEYYTKNIKEVNCNILDDNNNVSDDDFLVDMLETMEGVQEIDSKLENFKGKQDIEKIKKLYKFLQLCNDDKKLFKIAHNIINEKFNRGDYSFLDNQDIGDIIRYIFRYYHVFKDKLVKNIKDFYLEVNNENSEEENMIDKLKGLILESFDDLLIQIGEDNELKETIIKNVYEAKMGDPEAKDYVSKIMLKESYNLAKKYSHTNGRYDSQLESDLLQEALVSGLNGIQKYDASKNDNFVYYIKHWLKLGIYKYLNIHYNQIRIPTHIRQLLNKIQKIAQDDNIDNIDNEIDLIVEKIYEQTNKSLKEKKVILKDEIRESSEKEVKKELENKIKEINIKINDSSVKIKLKEKVKDAISKKGHSEVYSMDFLLRNVDAEDEGGIENNIMEDKGYDLSREVIDKEENEKLMNFLKTVLTNEELTVILHRYGLFGEDELLLDTLGKKLNKSAERIRQILNKAIEDLSKKSFDNYTYNSKFQLKGVSINKKTVI